MEVRQQWGKEIEVQRCIRLYDGRPAVVISAQVTNHTDRDVTIDAAALLDVSARVTAARGGSATRSGRRRQSATLAARLSAGPCRRRKRRARPNRSMPARAC